MNVSSQDLHFDQCLTNFLFCVQVCGYKQRFVLSNITVKLLIFTRRTQYKTNTFSILSVLNEDILLYNDLTLNQTRWYAKYITVDCNCTYMLRCISQTNKIQPK
jgi:hypothetical protein